VRTFNRLPQLELLEDRVVPSGTPLDLTTLGSSGTVGDAVFAQSNVGPAGSGAIHSFLRLQAHGKDAGVEQGYNTDARPLEFNEKKDAQHTRSLLLSDVAKVNVGGTVYREFLLDINEPGAKTKSLVSLDELKLYVSDQADLTGYDDTTGQLAGLDPVFDLDADADNYVLLNAKLAPGSGKADALVYVKDSLFSQGGDSSHVYLFSKFGENYAAEGGFEEWAARARPFTKGLGSISGTVFQDNDGDGQLTTGEMGQQGWVVFLDTNNNNTLDDGEVVATTDGQGHYTFTGLATGLGDLSTYTVREVLQDGFSQTSPDPDPIVLATAGQSVTDVNFGNAPTAP